MKKIEVQILNREAVAEAEKTMGLAAKITQHGHEIKSMNDLLNLYNKNPSAEFIEALVDLPHPTLQKFATINIAIVGASRRFLAQITRHQNEVKFMSASLQYSNYGGQADFVTPYEIINTPMESYFLESCQASMEKYQMLTKDGYDHDTAGYMAPQALRNILLIGATPFQWKHMIHQRTCRRNTDETRYVMLLIWEQLYKLSPKLFGPETTGAFCLQDKCQEGKMTCGCPYSKYETPSEILDNDFSKIRRLNDED